MGAISDLLREIKINQDIKKRKEKDAKLRYRKRHPNCKWCEFSLDESIEGKKMYMCLIKDDYSDESCEVYQPRMPKED